MCERLSGVAASLMLTELSVMLVMRKRDVSVWHPVQLLACPIVEACFTIYRKKFSRGCRRGLLTASSAYAGL